ncbi:MAG: hypothetical protein IKO40_10825, partial [Kiritimatiellae bacterium]|nr:hypothetical protein [Kiritimatiellia bacterium]
MAGGAFRAICAPRPPWTGRRQGTHLASDFARHPQPLRLRLRSSSSPQPFRFVRQYCGLPEVAF